MVQARPSPPVGETTVDPPDESGPSTPNPSAQIETTPAEVPAADGSLPSTGGNPNTILQLAIFALVLGVVLLGVKRRAHRPAPMG